MFPAQLTCWPDWSWSEAIWRTAPLPPPATAIQWGQEGLESPAWAGLGSLEGVF